MLNRTELEQRGYDHFVSFDERWLVLYAASHPFGTVSFALAAYATPAEICFGNHIPTS